ncbi:ABC transporter substrate-binding protein [Pigmentiphaga aceris]|uniref:ABC transporter substrate-binding protein n=1 Tax=Pigmentiphaga aceris TaxID=1940612 RepID=A0A5C0AYG1_9BURK|nr:ABC transporter substrate-binding protein [Pigmentiphaga aceris]QEI06726.1 ABC transporter substrate-binding protein [Pigmentiphaga aceris]
MKLTQIAQALVLGAALAATSAWAADAAKIPTQQLDPALRAKLPKDILDAGFMTAANNGSFPPYDIVSDTRTLTGASADMAQALGEILGITIKHETVGGLSGLLIGIKSGRYQFGMGPTGDFPDRQAANDFIDYVQEYVVFAVQQGNPKGIKSLDDTCGHRIAVMSGGSAEKVIKQQAINCTEKGKPAITVQSFADQPTSILAVRSQRSDAFFSSQAPLTYFVGQTNGALELAAVGQKNGFQDLYQGAVVAKGSPLGPILLEGLQKLYANGTYEAIMLKWGLKDNMLKTPGINLAGKAPQ